MGVGVFVGYEFGNDFDFLLPEGEGCLEGFDPFLIALEQVDSLYAFDDIESDIPSAATSFSSMSKVSLR